MALNGPIMLVEDDLNDAEVITAALKEVGATNDILHFKGAQQAVDYLLVTTEKPLMILCDIRMPEIDGLSLLKRICANDYLRRKSIPFIYYTAFVSKSIINEVYEVGVQGFFRKADSFGGIKEQLYSILMYWNRCLHPNADQA